MNNHSELVRELEEIAIKSLKDKPCCVGEYEKFIVSVVCNNIEAFILARDKKNSEPYVKALQEIASREIHIKSGCGCYAELAKNTLKNLGAE